MSYMGIGAYINIMNIMIAECKARKLEYVRIQDISFHDDERLVFNIMTSELNNNHQKCIVHVDFIKGGATVEQFLDCVYGSGSTSDLKIIIYNDHFDKKLDFIELTEFYFVTRLINKCNAIGISFDIIKYHNPADRSDLSECCTNCDKNAVREYNEAGPLPSKWDIQRMAFWALYYATQPGGTYYELHEFHCDRSFKTVVKDEMCIFVKWIEDGIYYVISDSDRSKFIPWLWKNREKYLKKDFPDYRTMSTYRDGVSSFICLRHSNTPIRELEYTSSSKLNAMGDALFCGILSLKETIIDAIEQYSRESEQVKDVSTQ